MALRQNPAYSDLLFFKMKKMKFRTILIFPVFFLLLGFLALRLFQRSPGTGYSRVYTPLRGRFVRYWDNEEYGTLLKKTEDILVTDPWNKEVLMYAGFSSFYEGEVFFSNEQIKQYMKKSVAYLRKLKLLHEDDPKVDYILGKAYFHLGEDYTDAAVFYLESSVRKGFVNKDTYEYLGLAYERLREYQKSLAAYSKLSALNQSSPFLFTRMGNIYMKLNRPEDALESYRKALKEMKNQDGREEILDKLIRLSYNTGKLKLTNQYKKQLADLHSLKGETASSDRE